MSKSDKTVQEMKWDLQSSQDSSLVYLRAYWGYGPAFFQAIPTTVRDVATNHHDKMDQQVMSRRQQHIALLLPAC
jgi:hypothetical protein